MLCNLVANMNILNPFNLFKKIRESFNSIFTLSWESHTLYTWPFTLIFIITCQTVPSSINAAPVTGEDVSSSELQITNMQSDNIVIDSSKYRIFTFIEPDIANHTPNMLYEFKLSCTETIFSINQIANNASKHRTYECRSKVVDSTQGLYPLLTISTGGALGIIFFFFILGRILKPFGINIPSLH